MDYDKLIEDLHWWAAYCGQPCGCLTSRCILDNAAIAIETLHAENRRLNEVICFIPTTPDSGRTIGEYDKEMSMCAYLDDLEAENKSLRADLVRMTAERDAAIEDLLNAAITPCSYCERNPSNGGTCDMNNDNHEMFSCWKWRGIKED